MVNYPELRERDGDEGRGCIYKAEQGVQGCICSHAVFMNPGFVVRGGIHVKDKA